jgi:hypothetical protein
MRLILDRPLVRIAQRVMREPPLDRSALLIVSSVCLARLLLWAVHAYFAPEEHIKPPLGAR